MKRAIWMMTALAALTVNGTAWGQFIVTNIAHAKRDLDIDFYPDDTMTPYRVKGRITSPNFNPGQTEFYIRDPNDNAGILVQSEVFTVDPSVFSTGREVRVTGYIHQSAGLRYIGPPLIESLVVTDFVPLATPPVPQTIAGLLADAEGYEGNLVLVTNVTIAGGTWPVWGEQELLAVSDGTGQLDLFIDRDTNLDGQLAPVEPFDLQGLFVQYDNDDPPDGGYEMLPRYYTDVIQSIGQVPPILFVAGDPVRWMAVGESLTIEVLGQDANAGDALAISAVQKPVLATFTDHGDRTGSFSWTPTAADAGTTNTVIFEVDDGTATTSGGVQLVVRTEELAHVILNEVHFDPAEGMAGDANGDGVRNAWTDEFVEIYNANTTAVDFSNWTLRVDTNVLYTFAEGTTVTAGTAVVIFGGSSFVGTFGNALVLGPAAPWDGLANAGALLSLWTDTGIQVFSHDYGTFSGFSGSYTGESLTRIPDVTGSFGLHTLAAPPWRWSPGTRANGAYFPGTGFTNSPPRVERIADRIVNAGVDISIPIFAQDPESDLITLSTLGAPASASLTDNGDGTGYLIYTGQIVDAGTTFNIEVRASDASGHGATAFALDVVQPTTLVFSEILQNPSAVVDTAGEWFELYNATGAGIDIDGWTIMDDDFDSHVIDNEGPLVVLPGGFLVLGNNTNQAINGGAPVDYSYGSSMLLANSADEIVLAKPLGQEVARVTYDGGTVWPDPTGASMYLKSPELDQNDGENWATSAQAWPGSAGDKGSPGAANEEGVWGVVPPPPPVELGSFEFTGTGPNQRYVLTWMSTWGATYEVWESAEPGSTGSPVQTGMTATPPVNTYTNSQPLGARSVIRVEQPF